MNCRHIIDLLGPYLDGECSPEERRQVEEHLRRCPACRSELEQLRRIESANRGTAPPDPGEEYWNTFLPRLRQRIDRAQRHPAPAGWGERIRRLFSPPVPWIRMAGAVATAVLVVVIGRAFIGQRGDVVPMRSPIGETPERIGAETAGRGKSPAEKTAKTPSAEKAPLEKEAGTAPVDEASAKKRVPTAPEEKISETGAGIAPAAEPPAVRDEAPEPETDRLMSEDRADAILQTSTITEEAVRQETAPAIQAMARTAAGHDWRDRVRHWEAVIDSSSDRTVLAAAHPALAESWYHLAIAGTDQDDITAALQAHRAALEYAAEDSLRQLLEQRIFELENRQQKK